MVLNKDIQKILEEVGFLYSDRESSGVYFIYNHYPVKNGKTFEVVLGDSYLFLRLTSKNIIFSLSKCDSTRYCSLMIKEWKVSRKIPIEEFSKIFLISIIKGSFLWMSEKDSIIDLK